LVFVGLGGFVVRWVRGSKVLLSCGESGDERSWAFVCGGLVLFSMRSPLFTTSRRVEPPALAIERTRQKLQERRHLEGTSPRGGNTNEEGPDRETLRLHNRISKRNRFQEETKA